MPIPRLEAVNTALLVIDVQERLMPSIADRERLIGNCVTLMRGANLLDLPTLVTEQYVKGLGRTVEPITAVMSDPSWRIEKTRFSALIDLVDEYLVKWKRSNVLICGLEAHVCVLQTVLDLQSTGRQAWYVTDAISAGQRDQIAPAFERMNRAGAIPTGIVSALYEMMGDATHPHFRSCLELAKVVVR